MIVRPNSNGVAHAGLFCLKQESDRLVRSNWDVYLDRVTMWFRLLSQFHDRTISATPSEAPRVGMKNKKDHWVTLSYNTLERFFLTNSYMYIWNKIVTIQRPLPPPRFAYTFYPLGGSAVSVLVWRDVGQLPFELRVRVRRRQSIPAARGTARWSLGVRCWPIIVVKPR